MDKNQNLGIDEDNKKLDKRLLTVKETANLLDETPNVVRNWMQELRTYIPLQKNEAGYNLFSPEAIEVMKQIKQLHRQQNYSIRQIQHYLATGGEAYQLIPEKKAEEILAEELQDMKKEIQELREYSIKQTEFNEKLAEKLNQQHEYIKSSLESRDQKLLETMNEMQESKKEAIATEETDKADQKGFFARLFGK